MSGRRWFCLLDLNHVAVRPLVQAIVLTTTQQLFAGTRGDKHRMPDGQIPPMLDRKAFR